MNPEQTRADEMTVPETPTAAPEPIGPINAGDLKGPRPRKRIPARIWVLVAVIVLALVCGILLATGIITLSKFTTTTYSTGSGQTFTFKYYRHTTTKLASAMPPIDQDTPTTGPDFLLGPTSADYPLSIQIRKQNNPVDLYSQTSLCNPAAITLPKPAAGQSSIVCHLAPLSNKQVLYFYELKQGNVTYLVTLMPYYDYAQAISDTRKADDVNNNVDITKYNDDIQTILSSIKLVSGS